MRRRSAVVVVAALLAATLPASAHMPIAGVAGFTGGLLHPILVPAHALALVALGLFVGRQDERRISLSLFALGLAGGLIAISFAIDETPAADVLLVDTAILGLLVAAAWHPPRAIGWLLAITAGAALALDSPPDTISIEEGNRILLGTGVGACAGLCAIVAGASVLTRPWLALGVRILGSWIAASAILVLALSLAA
jgi:urease accessory protein